MNENSPAEKSGLLPDDIITHIDGRSLQGMNFDESIQLMRGEVGTKVVFTIIKNDNVSENITLERESIEVPKFIQGIQLVNQGSLEEGYEILLDLAKNGDPDAQYIIGQINSLDRYNIKNYEEGFYWTKIAADQNHPDANYYLAVLYSVGQGVKKNLHLGHQYFLKAAELNIPAFLDLAFNYYYGEGASKNINEAIKWFNKTINFPVKDLKLATQNKFSSYKYLYYIFMYEDGFIDKNKAFEFANI